jgi:hypothetical protein
LTNPDNSERAFPSAQPQCNDGTWNQTYDPGMSLRDWFAGQASGMSDEPSPQYAAHFNRDAMPMIGDIKAWAKWFAKADATFRYIQADAMLAARKGGGA